METVMSIGVPWSFFHRRENIYLIDLPSNPLYADEQIMAQNTKFDWETYSLIEVEHSGRHFTVDISNVFSMENIL